MKFSQIVTLFLGLTMAVSTFAITPPLHKIDAFKVIIVEGEDMPSAVGLPLDDLSLAAMVDGVMEPIPYQIDQYNVGGAVYFEGWDVPLAGSPDVLDPTDKLLFLFKDAGEKYDGKVPYDGTLIAEILTLDRDGHKRYVYLVKVSRLRSDEQYVRYSSDLGVVETDFYSLQYDTENHLVWDDFTIYSFVGERPLDSMKLRLDTGVITPITNIGLNNAQMVAVPSAERIGPIRTTTQLDFTLHVLAVPFLQLSLQIHHYPKLVMYEARGTIPELRRKLLRNPSLSMSLDANKLMGASLRTSAGPKQPGIVDGTIDEIEKQMIEAGLDPHNNWIWASSKRNFDVLAFVDYLGDFNEPMGLLLEDDEFSEDPPEAFPGQLPNMGFRITDFPMEGFIGFVVSLFLSDGFDGEPEDFASYARTLPDIEVRAL